MKQGRKLFPRRRAWIAACIVAFCGSYAVTDVADGAQMRSKKLGENLCKTRGGGKFVRIPKSGGKKIDRRLLPDVRWMKRRYKIGIGDGYATSGHAPNGEHPIGLALDIYSVRGQRGWNKIDKLAKLAEPKQNEPILPWRWVGYNGDSGHGRGHHLHLSWAHNEGTTFGKPAKWVLTRKCPSDPINGDGRDGGGDGDGSGGSGGSGGIGTRSALDSPALEDLAPPVPESH